MDEQDDFEEDLFDDLLEDDDAEEEGALVEEDAGTLLEGLGGLLEAEAEVAAEDEEDLALCGAPASNEDEPGAGCDWRLRPDRAAAVSGVGDNESARLRLPFFARGLCFWRAGEMAAG